MIANKKSFLFNRIVHYYITWLLKRHFCKLLYNPIQTDNNRSVLLIGNHFSFWDSVILYAVNERLLKKKFHVMILEETSRKEVFLKYVGAFSINKKSRDIIQSLDYAAKLLDDPQNMVLIFPQGRLMPNFANVIPFEKGIIRIMNKATANFQLVFASTFIQYFKHLKPTATVYLKTETENYTAKDINKLQQAYQQHYDAAKLQQAEIEFDI